MNYYLHLKEEFDPNNRLPAYLGCNRGEEEPIELVNGWVWNNKYYSDLTALNKEYYRTIHIGKSSMGWRFFLCYYPTENPRFAGEGYPTAQWLNKPISGLYDWATLFDNPENVIVNEEGEVVSADEMMDRITNRKGRQRPDGWQQIEGYWYRVIDGLCVHDETRERFGRPELIDIMPSGCTYDLVLSGNDVESGVIFS